MDSIVKIEPLAESSHSRERNALAELTKQRDRLEEQNTRLRTEVQRLEWELGKLRDLAREFAVLRQMLETSRQTSDTLASLLLLHNEKKPPASSPKRIRID